MGSRPQSTTSTGVQSVAASSSPGQFIFPAGRRRYYLINIRPQLSKQTAGCDHSRRILECGKRAKMMDISSSRCADTFPPERSTVDSHAQSFAHWNTFGPASIWRRWKLWNFTLSLGRTIMQAASYEGDQVQFRFPRESLTFVQFQPRSARHQLNRRSPTVCNFDKLGSS